MVKSIGEINNDGIYRRYALNIIGTINFNSYNGILYRLSKKKGKTLTQRNKL